eukprot:TRINITY_DN1952_c0_g2_i1.p1 TRINITY_DN1952_c0_g2~~TRINITY_DN1952_c0_g2_i1.p1  ORF type:complete len:254 (+),score=78.98 TRINITY_DN1952_c0_g2_i1:64-762(+)
MADVADTIYVTGLALGITEDGVKTIFNNYGTALSVRILPKNEQYPNTAAKIQMASSEQAKWLVENVNDKVPVGMTSPITVKPAKAPSAGKGFGKGGKGFGKGMMNPMQWMQLMQLMKGKGKGWGGGWGGGKGWSRGGLTDFPPEKKVWIGGLAEGTTFQQLKDHLATAGGTPKYAKVMTGKGAGTGGVAFDTAEEATAAIEKLNGSELNGATIEVDVWTKKEKPAEPEASAE